MTLLNVIVAIFAFGFIIFFHELFHFLAAKIVGVEVKEFSVGFGKSLFAIQNKKFFWLPKKGELDLEEISYHLKMLPLGGYVMFERPVENEKGELEVKGEFKKVHPLKRIFIAIAGPVGNLLLAFVLLLVFYLPYMDINSGKVISVRENTIADSIGLVEGSHIISINDIKIEDLKNNVYDYDLNQDICINWETPKGKEREECVESSVDSNDQNIGVIFALSLTEWFTYTVESYINLISNYVSSLYELLLNIDVKDLNGPVGTVDVIQQSVPDWERFLSIMIIVNVALGLMNLLLPLSITDGGRIVIDLICLVRRKRSISTDFVDVVSIGIMILLFITTFYLDVSRIIEKIL